MIQSHLRMISLCVLALFVPFYSSATFGQTRDSDPTTLRVLSYNIHHAEGVDGKLDLLRIAEVIRQTRPDIVALQEVDQKVARSKSEDQPDILSKELGMHVFFGGNIELQGGHYGNALLSKFPIKESTNRSIPSHEKGEQRGIIDATIQLPSGTIRILATHFDHRPNPTERLASIDLVEKLVKDSQAPTLLCGDLNAEYESDVLDRARKEWTLANSERKPTIPVNKPSRQIDFVLFRPKDRWKVVSFEVLPEATASDHRAVLAVLQLNHEK